MDKVVKNLINGEWRESTTGDTFESVNPADTSEIVGVVAKSSREDVDEAVKAAREAYKLWRLVPPPKRGEILFRAAEILAKRKDELGELVTRELGKILPEGIGRRPGGNRPHLLHGG